MRAGDWRCSLGSKVGALVGDGEFPGSEHTERFQVPDGFGLLVRFGLCGSKWVCSKQCGFSEWDEEHL